MRIVVEGQRYEAPNWETLMDWVYIELRPEFIRHERERQRLIAFKLATYGGNVAMMLL